MPALGIVLSLLIGVSLGFFGGGGSILTVPLLVYVFGLDPKEAIASSLLIVAAASVAGAFQHWRAGNVEVRTAIIFGAAGMTGAYVGGRLGALIDGTLLLLLFTAMMILTAVAMWKGRRAQSPPDSTSRAVVQLVLQGLAVGSFTGLVGAGGGFLIVPALTLWAGLSIHAAVGTSLVIIILNTLAGFMGYINHVEVDYALVGVVGGMAIAGSFVGSRLAQRNDPSSLRRLFAAFVGVMAVVMLVREADAWVTTAQAALPVSTPQIIFAVIMLAIGVAAGRVTKRAGRDPAADRLFIDGGGI